MKKIFAIFLISLFLVSCGSEEKVNSEKKLAPASDNKQETVTSSTTEEAKNSDRDDYTVINKTDLPYEIDNTLDAVDRMKMVGSTLIIAEYTGENSDQSKEMVEEGEKLTNDYVTYKFKLVDTLAFQKNDIPEVFNLALGMIENLDFVKGDKLMFQVRGGSSDELVLDSIAMFYVTSEQKLISVFKEDENYNGYTVNEFVELLNKEA